MLEVKNLTVTLPTSRGPARAVRGLSFELRRGESLGLVGESGCGKSMTALALMGLMPEGASVGGQVLLEGKDILQLADRDMRSIRGRRMAMIFQEPMSALNPLHRVGQQVAEPMRLHLGLSARDARARAVALLERVGIEDASRRADAFPHQFSGGQRQRITIAMALACDPDLLIADEPTTALDVTVQRQILELIDSLVRERGMGLLLISHDLGVIAQRVAQTVVMYGGAMVERGPTPVLFAQAGHPYTKGLFHARPKLLKQRGQRLVTIPGSVPELADIPPGCPFAGRCALTLSACHTEVPDAHPFPNGQLVCCISPEVVAP